MTETERIAKLEAALRLIRETAENDTTPPSVRLARIVEATEAALKGEQQDAGASGGAGQQGQGEATGT
jgi:hypothetical protein